MSSEKQSNKPILGIAWMLLFCLASTVADGIVRYVTIGGFPSSQILFIRCFIGAAILLPFVIQNQSLFVTRKVLKLHIVRGIFAFLGAASWFYILKYVDFTALIAVGFVSPLFTAILAMIFLREKRSNIKIAALLIGFSGAMVVIKPFNADFNIYLLYAIGIAFIWSIFLVMTKQLANNQNPLGVAFFLAAVIAPLSFILALPVWQWPTTNEWFYIMLFVGFATLSQISMVKAFSHADLTTLVPFEYSGLIYATIFSYIVFGDLVTVNTLLGGAIILGSGYIIVRLEHKRKHKAQELEIIP